MIPLLLLGCAFGPGHGFGEIAAADLAVAFEPGEARDLGDGWVLANTGDRFTLDTLVFTVESLDLLALEGGGSATFDPANPPAGYSLCHGGHCHADDGRGRPPGAGERGDEGDQGMVDTHGTSPTRFGRDGPHELSTAWNVARIARLESILLRRIDETPGRVLE